MSKIKESLNEYVCNKERVKSNVVSSMIEEHYKKSNYFKFSVAFIVIALVLVSGIVLFNVPTAFVSLDINPSFMIKANILDRIITVETINDNSSEVISELSLYGKEITDGVNQIVNKSSELGYIALDDENAILVSTYCNNEQKRDKIQNKVCNRLNENLNNKGIKSDIIEFLLPEDKANITNGYGVSEAKVILVQKAIEENPDLKFEDLIKLPIREIVKYIDEYKDLDCVKNNTNNNGNQNSNNGNNPNGNGNGNGTGTGNNNGNSYGNGNGLKLHQNN